MRINGDAGEIEVLNEPAYTFGSADNPRTYPFAKILSTEASRYASHGVLLNGEPLVVFGNSGCTGVHQHSAIYLSGQIFLAIGDKVVCFCPKPFDLKWYLQVDASTCFGLHYQAERDVLISHGELEIARFSEDGRIVWSTLGSDIFSEGFRLLSHCIEATDFNRKVYHFDYVTGSEGG